MVHSDCGSTCGCAGKTVKSLENSCHTWALLRWWFTMKRCYIKCMDLYLFTFIWPARIALVLQRGYRHQRVENHLCFFVYYLLSNLSCRILLVRMMVLRGSYWCQNKRTGRATWMSRRQLLRCILLLANTWRQLRSLERTDGQTCLHFSACHYQCHRRHLHLWLAALCSITCTNSCCSAQLWTTLTASVNIRLCNWRRYSVAQCACSTLATPLFHSIQSISQSMVYFVGSSQRLDWHVQIQ